MTDILKKFGRYFLLDQIAQGGMAEIYRARLATADGAGRLIVIKRIQAGFGNNTEFLQMFRSEIKVTMGFNHPNIVQLYDYGEEQGQPYIAMELVDGKNLRQFMNRFNEVKKYFPVEIAVFIIEQAASGLHYAHSFKDKISGQALSIVHRDVSPQNILISYESNIKVIDFGIAKAATNSESTRAGVIKGKPSYLSPEQISGMPLDGRSDIFALGVVLWELLVGRKLFAGENDLAVLKLIESSQTFVKPPSTHNPKIPKELDAIVMKALTKNRDKRYQTAEELQRALHRFLYGFCPDFNPTDLAYSARDLFKHEIVEDRKRIKKLNDEVEKLLIASDMLPGKAAPVFQDDAGEGTPTDRSDHTRHTNTVVEPRSENSSGARELPDLESGKTESLEFDSSKVSKIPTPAERKPFKIEQPVKIGYRETGTGIPAPSSQASSQTSGPEAVPDFSPWSRVKARFKSIATLAAAVIMVAFFGPSLGIEIPGLSKYFHSGRTPDGTQVEPPSKTESGSDPFPGPRVTSGRSSVILHVNVTPVGSSTTIAVNGHPLAKSDPSIQVPLDAPLELVVQNPAYKTITREFTLEANVVGDQKDWTMDVPLDPSAFGYLSIKSDPTADVTITIDGKQWKKRTPFEKEKLPPGIYTVTLTNDLLQMERKIKVEIKEGEVSQPFDPDRAEARELKLNMNAERDPAAFKK